MGHKWWTVNVLSGTVDGCEYFHFVRYRISNTCSERHLQDQETPELKTSDHPFQLTSTIPQMQQQTGGTTGSTDRRKRTVDHATHQNEDMIVIYTSSHFQQAMRLPTT